MNIKALDDAYDAGAKELQERRQQWRATVDNVILPTLQKTRENMPKTDALRGVIVSDVPSPEGLGAVAFAFGGAPTGIKVTEGQSFSHWMERGAELQFLLTPQARVEVQAYPFRIDYSSGRALSEERDAFVSTRYDTPGEITPETVLQITESFLAWALRSSCFVPNALADVPSGPASIVWEKAEDAQSEEASPRGRIGFSRDREAD